MLLLKKSVKFVYILSKQRKTSFNLTNFLSDFLLFEVVKDTTFTVIILETPSVLDSWKQILASLCVSKFGGKSPHRT